MYTYGRGEDERRLETSDQTLRDRFDRERSTL